MSEQPYTSMYRIGGYGNDGVETVKVVARTLKTITILESWMNGPLRPVRNNLGRHGHEYFTTFAEARQALIDRRRSQRDSALVLVGKTEAALEAALDLKEPKA
jgi:hypothetical protein